MDHSSNREVGASDTELLTPTQQPRVVHPLCHRGEGPATESVSGVTFPMAPEPFRSGVQAF